VYTGGAFLLLVKGAETSMHQRMTKTDYLVVAIIIALIIVVLWAYFFTPLPSHLFQHIDGGNLFMR
jgi:antibiotic biosynthesis monooxygenase (ABM) superfamily enzyme